MRIISVSAALVLCALLYRASPERTTRLCDGVVRQRCSQPSIRQSPNLAPGDHNVVINGVRLWYRVAGKGASGIAPVVFLHGGPGYNSASFSVTAGPMLERSLQMVYLDQRGAGHSERPWDNQYSIPMLVDDVEGLRQTLGVERISLVGHSFGGLLALEYAAKYPDHVARVVLVSAAGDLPAACHARVQWLQDHRPDLWREVTADTSRRQAARTDCDLAFAMRDVKQLISYNRAAMFPDTTIGLRLDSIDAASGLRNTGEQQHALISHGLYTYRFSAPDKLTMPVLILGGQYDAAIGLDQQKRLAAALPKARLEIYERAGHFLYIDQPARFAGDVTTFLDGSSSRN